MSGRLRHKGRRFRRARGHSPGRHGRSPLGDTRCNDHPDRPPQPTPLRGCEMVSRLSTGPKGPGATRKNGICARQIRRLDGCWGRPPGMGMIATPNRGSGKASKKLRGVRKAVKMGPSQRRNSNAKTRIEHTSSNIRARLQGRGRRAQWARLQFRTLRRPDARSCECSLLDEPVFRSRSEHIPPSAITCGIAPSVCPSNPAEKR
jgi:hypothetical protein